MMAGDRQTGLDFGCFISGFGQIFSGSAHG
jgi:hypothetical protein